MSDQVIASAPAENTRLASSEQRAFGSFTSGVAQTFATRLLMLAGLIGSSVIVGRWLGPEGLGALAVVNASVALSLQIGSAGLPSANTYFISRDRNRLARVWANSIVFALIGGSLLAAGIVLLAKMKPGLFGGVPANLLVIAALSIPFQLLSVLGLNVLLAMDRIGQLNLLDSLSPALTLISAIIVLVVMRSGLTTLVSFNAAAATVLGLSLLWVIGRLLSRQKARQAMRPGLSLLKEMLVYGGKFYVSIMAGVVIFRADLLFVNHFRGAAEAGVYAVASQVSFLLMLLPGVIAALLFPRVASEQDPRGEFAVQVTRHASLLMIIMCIAAAAGSFALPLVYGARFADASIQLLILLPGIYLVSIESVLVQHFTGTGLPLAIPIFWLLTVALNVGLNFVLVPAWGARGAALSSTVSYALIFALVAIYFCRKTGRRLTEMFLLSNRELRELMSRMSQLTSQAKAHK